MEQIHEQDTNPMVVTGDGAADGQRRGAAWLQFPRRAIFLIAAWAVAIFLLRLWPVPSDPPAEVPGPPLRGLVSAEALERLPGSLLLLLSALALALGLALLLAAAGALVAWLQGRSPRLGDFLAALGRLALYTWMPWPVILTAFLLLLLLVNSGGGPPITPVGDNASTLLLGALVLSLYPALLAAQDAVRLGATVASRGAGRALLAALLQLGQALLLQTAGILSALTVVELVFARPGLGRLLVDSIFRRDFAVTVDALSLMALIVLLGRLLAELFGWARRFVAREDTAVPAPPQRPRRLWMLFAGLLLLLPLALVVLGLLTSPEAAVQQDLQQRLASPSLQHPLGTDALGRDTWARLRLGSLSTLSRASLLAGGVLLPALLLGLLAGALMRRGGWLWESVADFILLPIDALLFLPVVPAAAAFAALAGPGSGGVLAAALALLFLPRAARAARDMWRRRGEGSAGAHVLAALAGIFLLALFHGFVALLSVEYLGFGPPPPAPSLGQMLQESQQHLLVAPAAAAALVILLGALAFALFTAAAAISDFVDRRRPLVRFNE